MTTTDNTPITAARFALVCDGIPMANFTELQGIKTELKTTEFIESGENGLVQSHIPANPVMPRLTFKRAQTKDDRLWIWHESARLGEMGAARKSCSLVMYNEANEPVARYHMENVWVASIELGALRAGSADVLTETVTLVCDHLQRVSL